jgi:hypothetical protein
MGFLQGGLVDMNSYRSTITAHSTGESELCAQAAGAMSCAYIRMGVSDILFNDSSRPWTVPFFTDSSAAIAMNNTERPTARNKHISKRFFYGRSQVQTGMLSFYHVGDEYSLADLGTKNLNADKASFKLSIVEVPVSDHAIG